MICNCKGKFEKENITGRGGGGGGKVRSRRKK